MPYATCLVVDDGSTDETSRAAVAAGARVATLPINLGVGGALRTGFRYAVENGYEAMLQIDGDGQHDPRESEALFDVLPDADIVIGARFAGQGDYEVRGPRQWAMLALARVIGRIAHTELTDTTSGYKLCGPKAISIFAEHLPSEYLGDTIEALVIAARSGCKIAQVPVAMRVRTTGTPSHNPWRSAVYLARACMALTFAMIRPKRSFEGAAI
jgi:glycosyltransferase involved in cell wall biosynthesis